MIVCGRGLIEILLVSILFAIYPLVDQHLLSFFFFFFFFFPNFFLFEKKNLF